MHGIYKWFPEKKGATPCRLASSGVTLGIVAFAPVLAWVIGQFGWQTAFAVLAVVGLVWTVFWFIVGKEGPYTSRQAEQDIDGIAPEEATCGGGDQGPLLAHHPLPQLDLRRPGLLLRLLDLHPGHVLGTGLLPERPGLQRAAGRHHDRSARRLGHHRHRGPERTHPAPAPEGRPHTQGPRPGTRQ